MCVCECNIPNLLEREITVPNTNDNYSGQHQGKKKIKLLISKGTEPHVANISLLLPPREAVPQSGCSGIGKMWKFHICVQWLQAQPISPTAIYSEFFHFQICDL